MYSFRSLTGRGSVRTRLLIWNVCAVTAILGTMGAIIHYTVESLLYAAVDRDLERMTRGANGRGGASYPIRIMFANAGQANPSPPDPPGNVARRPRNPWDAGGRERTLGWGRFITLDGKVIFPSEHRSPWDFDAFKIASRGGSLVSTASMGGEEWRIRSVPVVIDG